MSSAANISESELQRFARLAAPLLYGTAARGLGPRAARNRPGPGLEFLDMHQYQQGDDIRHIDWRQSSRRQQTIVRRYRDESAADWFICVDCSASVRLLDSKWSMTIQLASALAYALLFAGHRVALLLFSNRLQGICRLGRGAHHYSALLHLLLQHDATDARSSNLGLCHDHLTRDSNAFVISDFLEPDGMRLDLRSMRSAVSAVKALQVIADDELQVPASGCVNLQDVESGEKKQIVLTEQAIERAGSALKSHGMRLRRDCAALDIGFTSCSSEDPWDRVLLGFLNAQS